MKLIEHFRSRYLERLLNAMPSYDAADDLCDQEVWKVIHSMRRQYAIAPWLQLIRSAGMSVLAVYQSIEWLWRYSRGKHRIAATQSHSGSNQTSGAGSGTGGLAASGSITGGALSAGSGYPSYPGSAAGQSAGVASQIAAPIAQDFADGGILAGEITAYRCWKLRDDGLLSSVIYSEYIWKLGEIAEGCPSADDDAGVYAYKSILLLHNYGQPDAGSITGTVHLWGDVYEHEHGYRAQYAAIASIDDSPFYDAKAIRKRYGLTKTRKKKKS